jgi:glycosyltransferase involved in cell wall biosynthesis
MKVLITVPRLNLPGGVASYFGTLRGELGEDKTFFEIGRTCDEKGLLAVVKRLCLDNVNFWKELSRENYELVHINPSLLSGAFLRDSILLLLARLCRKPVVVMFHGWDKVFERTIERYLLWVFRLVYRRATAFVVLANEFQDTLKRWSCAQRVFVETTVVDDAVFRCDPGALWRRRRTSLTFNVLFLARLERQKGIYEAIEAFAILKQTIPHAQLIMAGDGSDRVPVQEYVQKHGIGDVEFVGFVTGKQKVEVLSKAHVYLLPTSYGEGMPTTVLEAMAFGLPVITRPVGGLKDFFEDGRMGYLTESNNPRVFAELVANLAANTLQRETMGEYNHLYAKQRFAASKVASRMEKIYESVVAGR